MGRGRKNKPEELAHMMRRLIAVRDQRDALYKAAKLAACINPFGSVENAQARDAAQAAIKLVEESPYGSRLREDLSGQAQARH